MSKQNQPGNVQKPKDNKLTNKPDQTRQHVETIQSDPTNRLLDSAEDMSLQRHAGILNNPRLAVVQRQALAAKIGSVVGNQYLQRVHAQMKDDKGEAASVFADEKNPNQLPDDMQIQRASTDFQVRGKFTPDASEAERWKNFVFFDLNDSSLDGTQENRVKDFFATLADPSEPVNLVGYASEEGASGVNTQLVNDRVEEVAQQLAAEGYTGMPTRTSRVMASQKRIAYRQWRAVEMLRGKTSSSRPDCSIQPETTPFSLGQRITFLLAKVAAMNMLQKTADKLRLSPPPAGVVDIAKQIFGPTPSLNNIADGLDKVHSSLSAKTPDNTTLGTACHRTCQGGVLAFVESGTDKLTLCPAFFEVDMAQKVRILIHEASHMSPGLNVDDRAYGWERLMNVLGRIAPAHALDNADSYTLLVLLDNGLTSVPKTRPPKDDLSALPNKEAKEKVEEALAYLQRWNTVSRLMLNWEYNLINKGISSGSWVAPSLDIMRFIGKHFGLSVNAHRPRDRDRAAVAAIYDRYVTMGRAMREPLEITVSSGNTHWEQGPGKKVAVAPSLWRKNILTRVRLLLRRQATATDDISRGLIPAYVNLADKLRREEGEGP